MWKATNKVEFLPNLWTIHRSRNKGIKGLIFTREGLEQIGDIGRFKKHQSSKDNYAEEFRGILYTSQDLDRRFYNS